MPKQAARSVSKAMQDRERKVASIGEVKEQPMAMTEVTPEERHQLISIGAYYRAERRGFSPGHELDDWLEAEAEVDRSVTQPTLPTIAKWTE